MPPLTPLFAIQARLIPFAWLMETIFLLVTINASSQDSAFYSHKPLFKAGNGYISYNYNYRSGADSSVSWNNISQHLVTAGFNAVLVNRLPITITYTERQSNSPYFRDFRDVRVDLNVQQFRRMQQERLLKQLRSSIGGLDDSLLEYSRKAASLKSLHTKDLVNNPSLIQQLIKAKETLIRGDFPDTSIAYKDSVIGKAKQFINYFDSLRAIQKKYQQVTDSLNILYQQVQLKARRIKQLLSGRPLSPSELNELGSLAGKNTDKLKELRQSYDGIRAFSLGRTLPNYSNLTLQNVNINGINLEYGRNNIYMAATAGMVDFRIRDFLYRNQKPVKQYLYAARVGYGTKEKDNIILTYFRGRKQLFGGPLSARASDIQGVSLAGQFFIYRGIKVYGEVAQSGIPYIPGNGIIAKPSLRLNDNSQRAYAAGFNAWLARTNTIAEGQYRYSGLNYQSFNSFQYNAAAHSWSFGITQQFWKRQLTVQANFRKNDFLNPIVLQRYNANTVYKSLLVTFRKTKWPVITAGYQPASQFTAVGNDVYENHYQSFMASASHQYKLGLIKATSVVMMSRFYNDKTDTGLVYYNSSNFFWNQTFQFSFFSMNMNMARMKNGEHDLVVMEEGISSSFLKQFHAGFAVKINNLNRLVTRIGFNTNARVSIPKIGELDLWMEQSYLPSTQATLFQYRSYNLSLTRYF
jgi:hypothetical protein